MAGELKADFRMVVSSGLDNYDLGCDPVRRLEGSKEVGGAVGFVWGQPCLTLNDVSS